MLKSFSAALIAVSIIAAPAFAAGTSAKTETKAPAAPVNQSATPKAFDSKAMDSKASMDKAAVTKSTATKATDTKATATKHVRHRHVARHHRVHKHSASSIKHRAHVVKATGSVKHLSSAKTIAPKVKG